MIIRKYEIQVKFIFLFIFFFNSFKSSIFSSNQSDAIVTKTMNLISESNVLQKFYDALLVDIENVYKVLINVLEQTTNKNLSIEERISNYKNQFHIFSFLKDKNNDIVSKEKKNQLLSFVIYNFFIIFSNEKSTNKFLENQNITGIGMLMTMTGVSFSCLQHIKTIMRMIQSECSVLKNNDIEDIRYQETVYKIIELISEKILEQNLFLKVINTMYTTEKEEILAKLANKNINKAIKKIQKN